MTRVVPLALLFVVVPLVAPLTAGNLSAWREADRLLLLLAHSAGLIAGVLVLAVPVGTLTALALDRLPITGSAFVRALVAVGLFVPLPVYAIAWQAVLGRWLPPLRLDPGAVAWRPWEQGLLPATLVHAAAAVPWVVWIVSAVTRATDRTLEDEAALTGGPVAVWRLVLGPRLRLAVLAAAGWVAVQAGTEIPVTDAMMVRTFAEEVYTQMVGSPDGVRAAVGLTLPVWLAAVGIGLVVAPRVVRLLPTAVDSPRKLPVPRWVNRTATVGVWIGVLFVAGLPAAALVHAASTGGLGTELGRVVKLHGQPLASSLASAAVAGCVTVGLAVTACHVAVGRRWFARLLVVVVVLAAVTPGPIVGLGLKATINGLLDAEQLVLPGGGPLRLWLYDSPSAVPGVWAAVVRFFPLAVVVCWPAVRAVPRELHETAALDGGSRFRSAVWPSARRAVFLAAAAVAVLALGEVSASKLVCPPGRREYVLELFAQMHYGAEANVAAMAVVQVLATAGLVLGIEAMARGGRG